MVDALEACDPATRVVWVAGDIAPRTLATTRSAETWIHTGDVCEGLGIEQSKSDRIWLADEDPLFISLVSSAAIAGRKIPSTSSGL